MRPRIVQIGSNVSSPNVSINENKQAAVEERPEEEEGNFEEDN